MVIYQGDVAQLVERGLCKPEVVGSNPIVSTKCRRSHLVDIVYDDETGW